MPTPTVEAYLEIIYMMQVEEQPVIGARLAESLHVSRPTVTTTLKRMLREGLVKLNPRKEIQMTDKGRAIAEHLQHRHRIVERWLTDELGLDWARSDAEAHHLEHAMSDEVAELLNKHLGYPATCPHGNPIPGNPSGAADGNQKSIQLSTVRPGDRVQVMRVSEYAENIAELLEYLGQRAVTPGAQITVADVAPLQGPLTLQVGARTISMSREVANFVWVKRSEP